MFVVRYAVGIPAGAAPKGKSMPDRNRLRRLDTAKDISREYRKGWTL